MIDNPSRYHDCFFLLLAVLFGFDNRAERSSCVCIIFELFSCIASALARKAGKGIFARDSGSRGKR